MGTTLGYQPALDGLRALAITAVVGVHAFGVPAGGGLGVDLFFVLSGFLITTLLLEEHSRTGRVALAAFYGRRALRLLPAFFVVLATYLAVSLFVISTRESTWEHLRGALAGLFYVANVVQASSVDAPDAINHLWSLSAEEQFYAVWPALLLLFGMCSSRWRRGALVGMLICLLAAIQVWQLALLVSGAPSVRIVYGPDTRAMAIVVGCLLAVYVAGRARPTVGPVAAVGASAVVVGALVVGFGRGTFAGVMLVFACASAMLVLAALDSRTWLARVLAVGPVVYLGRISYSLYLWHAPILVWVTDYAVGFSLAAVVAIVLSVAAAAATYHLVEQPLRRRRSRRSARPVAPRVAPRPALASAQP